MTILLNITKHRYTWIIIFLAIALCGCEGTYNSSIPAYPVNYELNIATENPHFVPANIMQHIVVTKPRLITDRVGFGGLLIITGLDEAYYAFDLACPVEIQRDVRVEIDGMYAVCPQCGEKYEVFYGIGNPTQGISRETLRRYTCMYINGVLRITN